MSEQNPEEVPTPEEIQSEIDNQILWSYLEMDDDGNLVSSPSNPDELHEFIRIALGFNIPRKQVEPHHRAPFDFVSDLFFEKTKNALGFANRTGGKTLCVAVLNFVDLLFKPGCEVASAGAVLDQAEKCYRYLANFFKLPWFAQFNEEFKSRTGRNFLTKTIQKRTDLGNTSSLEILTGNEKGLRSPHPHKMRIDEIDQIPWSILQTGLSVARSDNNIRGQNVFTSTRQVQNGSMQRLLDEAEQKGIAVYEWNIWETLERCKRRCENDPVHGTCPIYTYCQGKAHHCDGFYKIDDFIEKVRLIDREVWETEWLNLRPSKHKLVYHMFDNGKHIMTPKRLYQMFRVDKPQITWPRVSGIDFGSSPEHPFVYLKLVQLPNHAWLVWFEYTAFQRLLMDHAAAIKRSPFYLRGELCYADHDAQDRLELKNLGIITKPAKKDIQTGIDYVSSLFRGFPPKEEPMLYVWYECSFTLSELGMYSWPSSPNGKIDRSGNPEKKNDHAMDVIRYCLFSGRNAGRPKYTGRNITGI
jgi:hypothetical protein